LIQLENIFTLNILNRWWSNRQIHWCLIIWTRNRNRNLDSFLFLSSKSIWLRRNLNRNVVIRFDVSRWGIINVVVDILVIVSVLEGTWATFGYSIDGLELQALFFYFEVHLVVNWRRDWNLLIISIDAASCIAVISHIVAWNLTYITQVLRTRVLLINVDIGSTVFVTHHWRESF